MSIEKHDALKSTISSIQLRLRKEIVNFLTPDHDIIMIRKELKNSCEKLILLEHKQPIAHGTTFPKAFLIISIILISSLLVLLYKFGQIALRADDLHSAALVNRCGNLPGEELNPIDFIQKSVQRQKCLQTPVTEFTHIEALVRKTMEVLSD